MGAVVQRVREAVEGREIALRLPVESELRLEADREWRDVRVSGWIESDGITGGDRGRLAKLRGLRLRLEPALTANVAERHPDAGHRDLLAP